MSDDDKDWNLEPQGDAGEPPRLLGVVGGIPVQAADPVEAILLAANDKSRVSSLLLAISFLSRDPEADEYQAVPLAIQFEAFLKTGADTREDKSRSKLTTISGGKSSA